MNTDGTGGRRIQWPAGTRWIQDPRFAGLKPRNLFAKQCRQPVLPAHDPELRNVHMFARRVFQLPAAVRDAELLVTADDYYKLYVNGVFVVQGPAPAYHFRYNVNCWDLAEHLVPGDNVLAVHVYYQGLVNRVWNSGDYRQGLAGCLTAGAVDGSRVTVATDGAWKHWICPAYAGDRTMPYDTQFAEDIDARLLPANWREVSFDDSEWPSPAVRPLSEMDYTFVLQDTPALELSVVRPASVCEIATGWYRVDFGREVVGHFGMRVRGRRGKQIEIRHGEELASDGLPVCPTRCGCDYREQWTLAGEGEEELEAFDYKGFRYVEVSQCPSVLDPHRTWAVERHYPWPEGACRFESSDPTLNAIWEMCALGVKLCAQEQFVDCPTREKGQYLNDCVITGHAHMLLTGDARLVRKSLRDFALTRSVCPGLLAVAPGSKMQEIADASLTWPIQLWEYFQHTGDREFLRRMRPTVEGLVRHFLAYENSRGLLADVRDKWNLVDWPPGMRDGYDFDLTEGTGGTGCQSVLNAYYYGCLAAAGRMRSVLGSGEDAPLRLEALREAFQDAFFDRDSGLFVDAEGSQHKSLHANVLPLYFGLAPTGSARGIVDYLKARGMACGVSIAYYLLRALIDAGEQDEAYRLVTGGTGRSWRTMLDDGATACMEAWGAGQKWNTSFCHAWAAGPVPVLVESFFGLTHSDEGWRTLTVLPRIPDALEWAVLEVKVPQGTVRVEHCGGEDGKSYRLGVPPSIEVTPPPSAEGWREEIADVAAGRYVWRQGRDNGQTVENQREEGPRGRKR